MSLRELHRNKEFQPSKEAFKHPKRFATGTNSTSTSQVPGSAHLTPAMLKWDLLRLCTCSDVYSWGCLFPLCTASARIYFRFFWRTGSWLTWKLPHSKIPNLLGFAEPFPTKKKQKTNALVKWGGQTAEFQHCGDKTGFRREERERLLRGRISAGTHCNHSFMCMVLKAFW